MKKIVFVGLALFISSFFIPLSTMACDDCPPPPPPCDNCNNYTGEWSHGGSTYLADNPDNSRWVGSSGYDGRVDFDVNSSAPQIYIEIGGDGHSKTEYRPIECEYKTELIYTESAGKAYVWKGSNKP